MKWLAIVLILIFLVGCQMGTKTREEAIREEFRTGTQGIEVQFVPNLPPSRLYDDQELDVLLEVYNRGAAPVGYANDRIFLSGFDPSIITGISSYGIQIPPLEGKSLYNAEGDRYVLSFKGIIRSLGAKNIDHYDTTLMVTSCYAYETIASETVCVDPDPFSITVERKVCTPTNVGAGTQGGPIAVSNIEVDPSPGRTRFNIHVSNVGGGTALRAGADVLARCSPYAPQGLGFDDIDYVRLDSVEVSGINILNSCRPLDNGNIRISNGKGVVTCEYRAPRTAPEFTTPLTVRLSYNYRQTMTKGIRVVRSD